MPPAPRQLRAALAPDEGLGAGVDEWVFIRGGVQLEGVAVDGGSII